MFILRFLTSSTPTLFACVCIIIIFFITWCLFSPLGVQFKILNSSHPLWLQTQRLEIQSYYIIKLSYWHLILWRPIIVLNTGQSNRTKKKRKQNCNQVKNLYSNRIKRDCCFFFCFFYFYHTRVPTFRFSRIFTGIRPIVRESHFME